MKYKGCTNPLPPLDGGQRNKCSTRPDIPRGPNLTSTHLFLGLPECLYIFPGYFTEKSRFPGSLAKTIPRSGILQACSSRGNRPWELPWASGLRCLLLAVPPPLDLPGLCMVIPIARSHLTGCQVRYRGSFQRIVNSEQEKER